MDKQYLSGITAAGSTMTFPQTSNGNIGKPLTPSSFVDMLHSAESAVQNLSERVEALQIKLVGSFPESAEAGFPTNGIPDGVLPAANLSAQRICSVVRRMHELLDRIDSALPGA